MLDGKLRTITNIVAKKFYMDMEPLTLGMNTSGHSEQVLYHQIYKKVFRSGAIKNIVAQITWGCVALGCFPEPTIDEIILVMEGWKGVRVGWNGLIERI